MAAIPERVWALLTEEETERLQEIVAGWRHEPNIVCPVCNARLGVRLKISAGAVNLDVAAGEPRGDAPVVVAERRNATDAKLLEAARHSGLMTAFEAAVKVEKEFGGIPGNMDDFFLLFLRTAAYVPVSAVTLAAWKDEFDGFINVIGSQGVLAVLSDGEVKAFFPNRLTRPVPFAGTGPRPKISNEASFEVWTKGRYGYVPAGAKGFASVLRQANIGKFGTLVQ